MTSTNIHFHSGIYRFTWPYIPGQPVRDGKNEVKVYTCDVEIHVGDEEALN